jgi:hypothetical protein
VTREWKTGLCILGVALALAAGIESCDGAEATLQSARPWTIGQCDRLAGRRASAVFNRSIYSSGGWPLWQVTCIYPKGGIHVQQTRL